MRFEYKEFVREIYIHRQGNSRYYLTAQLKSDSNKSVLVIMKNPSEATKEVSDKSINNVLRFCHTRNYNRVIIMNIYPIYSKDPKEMLKSIEYQQKLKDIININDMYMKEMIIKVDEVIVAWGGNTFGQTKKYKKRIKEVVNIIGNKNKYYVDSISICGWYPRHAQVWRLNKKINLINWVPPKKINKY